MRGDGEGESSLGQDRGSDRLPSEAAGGEAGAEAVGESRLWAQVAAALGVPCARRGGRDRLPLERGWRRGEERRPCCLLEIHFLCF